MAVLGSLKQGLASIPWTGIGRAVRWFGIVIGAVVLIAGIIIGYVIYSSLPTRDGILNIDGLTAPIEIARDPRGVPHIFAIDSADANFALGFVHAQDRLWQMEAMRRFASGRLSEIVGPRTLKTDRLMRTLGFARLVERQYALLSPEARTVLDRYAAGVNAWIMQHRGALPAEFQILGFEPEAWKPTDSLLWVKVMAMRLSGNFRDEIARSRLVEVLGRERTDAFWYPDITPVETSTVRPRINKQVADAMLDVLGDAGDLGAAPMGASNAWAVRGNFSGTGGPILANDPHLGFAAPILWYLVRIETPKGQQVGATAPGVPFIILGHNGAIAWGLTTTQTDQQDVFVERLGDDASTYLSASGFKSFTTRRELIAVKGGDDVEIIVRGTERGPVISDVLGTTDIASVDEGGTLSLRAAFLDEDDRTPEALFKLGNARTTVAFLSALRDVHAPQQNVLFATTGGEIGFVAAGGVPIRRGHNGRYPARGWAAEDQWTGYIPFNDLPNAINPPGNRIVTANNKIVGDDYPYFITDDWAPPYRARRIYQMMANRPQSPDTAAEAQRDATSLMAVELLPFLKSVEPISARIRAAQNLLQGWDGAMIRRRPEPLIFYAWLKHLNRLIYADDLGPLFESHWRLRPRFIHRVLTRDKAWCDDVTTEQRETCDEMVARAFTESLQGLVNVHESGIVRWRWGDDHRARFDHPVFSGIPILNRLANLSIDVDGGSYTVNRAAVRINDRERPFDAIHGAGFRAIYDLVDLGRSRFAIATGQSGNIFSKHYDDLMEDWRNGLYFRLDIPRAVLHGADETKTLMLMPTGQYAPAREPGSSDPEPALPLALTPSVVPPSLPQATLPSANLVIDRGATPLIENLSVTPSAPVATELLVPLTAQDLRVPEVPADTIAEPTEENIQAGDVPIESESMMSSPNIEETDLFALPEDDLVSEPEMPNAVPEIPQETPQETPMTEPTAQSGALVPPVEGETAPVDPSAVDEIEESINDLMRSITESLDPLEQ